MPVAKENLPNPSVFDYYPRLRRVRNYVEENLDQPIQLADVARVASLSPGYFSSLFHRRTGLRFHRWLVGIRVERAKRELRAHNVAITKLAHDVGFGDLRTFERVFKQHSGQTPSEFRRSCRPR